MYGQLISFGSATIRKNVDTGLTWKRRKTRKSNDNVDWRTMLQNYTWEVRTIIWKRKERGRDEGQVKDVVKTREDYQRT